MRAPDTVTTDRLVLRRIRPADRSFLLTMWSDADVTRTLGGPRDADQVQAGLDAMADHWARRGFGNYIVRDRTTEERTMAAVGFLGHEEVEHAGLPHVLARLDLVQEAAPHG